MIHLIATKVGHMQITFVARSDYNTTTGRVIKHTTTSAHDMDMVGRDDFKMIHSLNNLENIIDTHVQPTSV